MNIRERAATKRRQKHTNNQNDLICKKQNPTSTKADKVAGHVLQAKVHSGTIRKNKHLQFLPLISYQFSQRVVAVLTSRRGTYFHSSSWPSACSLPDHGAAYSPPQTWAPQGYPGFRTGVFCEDVLHGSKCLATGFRAALLTYLWAVQTCIYCRNHASLSKDLIGQSHVSTYGPNPNLPNPSANL